MDKWSYPVSCGRPHQCTIVRPFLSRFPLQHAILWGPNMENSAPAACLHTCLDLQTAVFIPLCVHTAVSGYYSCKFSRSTMYSCVYTHDTRVDMAVPRGRSRSTKYLVLNLVDMAVDLDLLVLLVLYGTTYSDYAQILVSTPPFSRR